MYYLVAALRWLVLEDPKLNAIIHEKTGWDFLLLPEWRTAFTFGYAIGLGLGMLTSALYVILFAV